ncbi:MAG: acetyltransferase [Desulfuromonadaceae bacterium]|nr:acetyltransferase [Desulfuromonadaceae bacterium]MDD5107507.1 acetyltransferase [Desulfuromonadaceae bacterium]
MDQVKSRVVIWGASGHARVVADVVRLEGCFELRGFIDDVDQKPREFLGLPVFGGCEALGRLKADGVSHIILGFGNCEARLKLSEVVLKEGFSLASAIHPHAVIAADASIGDGTVIAAGSIINPGSRVGANVIINTRASVDHDCEIADGAHICPGVTLGGYVMVGKAAWVGIGSIVSDHVNIGSRALIGAGSVVVSDIPECVVAYGVPARIKRVLE